MEFLWESGRGNLKLIKFGQAQFVAKISELKCYKLLSAWCDYIYIRINKKHV